MSAALIALCIGVFAAAALLTGLLRRRALRERWLDVPNERSSHSVATPRGGGLAIVGASMLGFVTLLAGGDLDAPLCAALLVGGGAVALVGFIDDRRPVGAGLRLGVHLAAATLAVVLLGGVPPLQIGAEVVHLGWFGHAVGVVAIGWSLNLFNFMDGIDGIAASEAAFIGIGAAVVALLAGAATATGAATVAGAAAAAGAATASTPPGLVATSLVFAAACLGFLVWNWPPARIFMGDAGSGYLGYVIALLALGASRHAPAAAFAWLALGGAFFADATATLLRRLLRRERLHQAHRTHAYQWLSRRWASHRAVTLALGAANLAWSLPLAWLCTRYPQRAALLAIVALLPWFAVAIAAGAGQPETPAPKT